MSIKLKIDSIILSRHETVLSIILNKSICSKLKKINLLVILTKLHTMYVRSEQE